MILKLFACVLLSSAVCAAQDAYDYKLLATNKTSTMQKELQEAGDDGYKFVGVTVSKTSFGGKEVLSIMRKELAQ